MSATIVQFTVTVPIMAALAFYRGKEVASARLIEIANQCPVHRTLTSEINIQARLL